MYQAPGQTRDGRLFRRLTILSFAFSGALVSPTWAAPVTTTATAGSNPQVIGEYPASANASHSFSNPDGSSGSSSAFASPGAWLSVSATSTGWSHNYGAGAGFSFVADTTFNYEPDFEGEQDDWVEVSLTGVLSGTIVGTGLGGTGSARARVSVSGNIWTAAPEDGGTFIGSKTADTGDRGGEVRSYNESQVIDITEFVSTGRFWVPRGEPVSFSASLGVQVASDRYIFTYGTVSADFDDTFVFDPYSLFDIYTPGVTANSPAIGLVNNQLVEFIEPVPVPAALPLLASCLAIVGAGCCRRTRAREAQSSA